MIDVADDVVEAAEWRARSRMATERRRISASRAGSCPVARALLEHGVGFVRCQSHRIARTASRCTCGSASSSSDARSGSASVPPNSRSRWIAVRRTAGLADLRSCSTDWRPAGPNPSSKSREPLTSAVACSSIASASASGLRTAGPARWTARRAARPPFRRRIAGARRRAPSSSRATSWSVRCPRRGRLRRPSPLADFCQRSLASCSAALEVADHQADLDVAHDRRHHRPASARDPFRSSADRAAAAGRARALRRVGPMHSHPRCAPADRRETRSTSIAWVRASDNSRAYHSDTNCSSVYDVSMLGRILPEVDEVLRRPSGDLRH